MKMKITIQDKTFDVEINDLHTRPIRASVDGEIFEVWPEETESARPSDAVVTVAPQPAAPTVTANSFPKAASGSAVIAPIPGVITEIKVAAGESVTYGQELCVLEAMKMLTNIVADMGGKVTDIFVSPGSSVEIGDKLMMIEV